MGLDDYAAERRGTDWWRVHVELIDDAGESRRTIVIEEEMVQADTAKGAWEWLMARQPPDVRVLPVKELRVESQTW
jgi:hypothetical protein